MPEKELRSLRDHLVVTGGRHATCEEHLTGLPPGEAPGVWGLFVTAASSSCLTPLSLPLHLCQLSGPQLTCTAPSCESEKAPFPPAHPVCHLSISHLDWYFPKHRSFLIIFMTFATSIYCLDYNTDNVLHANSLCCQTHLLQKATL